MTLQGGLAAGLLAGLAVAPLAAQPFLVKNVNSVPDTRSGSLQWIPTLLDSGLVGGRLFFTANDGVHGPALWVTDGTDEGTYLVRDFPAGTGGYGSFEGLGVGGLYFFNSQDGVHGSELWISDGTEANTRLLVDFYPGPDFGQPQYFAELNGVAYFRANSALYGNELFRSDGTVAGTHIVRDLVPNGGGSFGGNASRPVRVGNQLFFGASTPELGEELWKTDGTEAGTVLVRDITPGSGSSSIYQMVAYANVLVFSAVDSQGQSRVWRSDGTSVGTFMLSIPGAPTFPLRICSSPAGVFFIGRVGSSDILFRTDGTNAGTVNLGAVDDCYGFGLDSMGVLPNGVVFPSRDTAGCELWFSDGTPGGTGRLIDISPGAAGSYPQNFINVPELGLVFFIARASNEAGDELWRTDGTPEGTFAVTDLAPSAPLSFYSLKPGRDVLYFAADDGVHGTELWMTDGTVEGTRFVKDIRPALPDGSGDPAGFTRAGNAAYFAAWNPATGTELHRTDGRPGGAGTVMVKDINPGPGSSFSTSPFSSEPSPLNAAAMGDVLFFRANDGVTGSELWRTDGTAGGTRIVADIIPGSTGSVPMNITPLDDVVIFTATPPGANQAPDLWRTDGMPEGTFRLRPDCNTTTCRGTGLAEFIRYHDRVFFRGYSQAAGTELFSTSGAADPNDLRVIDVAPGAASSTPANFVIVNDKLVFRASSPLTGRELWSSMGTAHMTAIVRDIVPGIGSSTPSNLISTGTRAFFTADDGTGKGIELWVTDATAAGTHLVRDIVPGSGAPSFRTFVVSGERLYFIADDHSGIGYELWTSDGTADGTHLVADLLPDNNNPEEQSLLWLTAAPDERVVFSLPSAGFGYELWESDGTAEGTVRISDINPGAESSWPERPFVFDRTVLFSAFEPGTRRELWGYRFAGGACPCDWDLNGVLDSRDFFEFLRDFFANAADFDGSGATDTADFFAFLTCFLDGGCR